MDGAAQVACGDLLYALRDLLQACGDVARDPLRQRQPQHDGDQADDHRRPACALQRGDEGAGIHGHLDHAHRLVGGVVHRRGINGHGQAIERAVLHLHLATQGHLQRLGA